ncbi:MAG: hypothetical protein R2764_01730 [Bacteroidales bacterium]
MKNLTVYLTVIILAFSTTILNAQEEEEMKYIFSGNKNMKVSGFIGPIMEFSAMGDKFAFFMGGGGGLIFNQTFFFGGYGEGLTTSYRENLFYGDNNANYYNEEIGFGHGGFWLGYMHNSKSPIHAGVSTKLGWGSIDKYNSTDKYSYDYSSEYRDNVFVIIPQIEAEMNLFKWLKLNVGVGYRVVTGVNKTYAFNNKTIYNKKDFNKPQASMSLLFGFFK